MQNLSLDNLVRDLHSVNPKVRYEGGEIPISKDSFIARGGMGVVYGNEERVLKLAHLGTYAQKRSGGQTFQEVQLNYRGKGIMELCSSFGEEEIEVLHNEHLPILANIDSEEAALDTLKEVPEVVKKNSLRFFKLRNGELYTLCSVFDLERIYGLELEQVITFSLKPEEYLKLILLGIKVITEIAKYGISHRDIKPNNLIRTYDGVKIIDFGVAYFLDQQKLLSYTERSIQNAHLLHEELEEERNSTCAGTPGYMAPETVTTGPSHKSDGFSLGSIIHKMLTRKLPIKGEGNSYLLRLGDLSCNGADLFYEEISHNLIENGFPEDFADAIALALHPNFKVRSNKNLIEVAQKYLACDGEGLPKQVFLMDVDPQTLEQPTIPLKGNIARALPPPPTLALDETLSAYENDFFIPKD